MAGQVTAVREFDAATGGGLAAGGNDDDVIGAFLAGKSELARASFRAMAREKLLMLARREWAKCQAAASAAASPLDAAPDAGGACGRPYPLGVQKRRAVVAPSPLGVAARAERVRTYAAVAAAPSAAAASAHASVMQRGSLHSRKQRAQLAVQAAAQAERGNAAERRGDGSLHKPKVAMITPRELIRMTREHFVADAPRQPATWQALRVPAEGRME